MSFLEDYQPVEDRLRLFWEDHPYGRVITELLHHEDGEYIVLASVYFGNELRNDPPTATGLAHDSVSSLPNNMKSSALEVCETSAIGRALANAGYAPKDKRPSREEMQKAAGGLGALPSPSAAITPEGKAYGEGADPSGPPSDTGSVVAAGEAEGGGATPLAGVAAPTPPSASEPHVHVPGRKLRSGNVLCIYEYPDGRICGKSYKPPPTIHTVPLDEAELRSDLV